MTILEPKEIIVNHTQMAVFTCKALGIPVPNITWIKVSESFVLTTSMGVVEISEVIMDSFTRVSNLTFLNSTRTNQSKYTCVGSNGIMNVIGTPENDIVSLLVQGEVLILHCTFY